MKPKTSRHANPSMEVLAPRIDRKLNAIADLLKDTWKPLADEFTRVLRQNDTLRGQNETLQGVLDARDKLRLPHVYVTGQLRCTACGFLREALEKTGIDCGAAMKLNEMLRHRERAKKAADAFISEPQRIPTLRIADVWRRDYPSAPAGHDMGESGKRCLRCDRTKEAIEACKLECLSQ